jgi:hypothetical protein
MFAAKILLPTSPPKALKIGGYFYAYFSRRYGAVVCYSGACVR